MNKNTALSDSGAKTDDNPKTTPKIAKPITATTAKPMSTETVSTAIPLKDAAKSTVAKAVSSVATTVTKTSNIAKDETKVAKIIVPAVSVKPQVTTAACDASPNKDVTRVAVAAKVMKKEPEPPNDSTEKANLAKDVTKPKSIIPTVATSTTKSPSKISLLDPSATNSYNDPASLLLSPLSEYSSSRKGFKSARIDPSVANGGGYNTGRISEEGGGVGGTEAESTNSYDHEIKRALLSRSWKTINSQDRGHSIYWSDIFFPDSSGSSSDNNDSNGSNRDSEGALKVKTLKPSFDFNATANTSVTPNSSNKTTDYNTAAMPPVTLTNTPRSSNSDIIIGKGTFGVVIKGVWRKPTTVSLTSTKVRHNPLLLTPATSSSSNSSGNDKICINGGNISPRHKTNNETFHFEDIEVAIKVLTISTSTAAGASATAVHSQVEFESLRYRSFKEAAIMIMAKKKIKSTHHIIDAYGIIEGTLPLHLANLLRLPEGERCICLVTRYEGGGSLHSLIANKNKARVMISTKEKLRLLLEVIQGLHELHTVGIIHADIKPENVLLSQDEPPMIRLADFGLSMLRDMEEVNRTSLIDMLGAVPVSEINSSDDNEQSQLSPRQHHHSGDGNLRLSTLASTTRTQGTMTYCAPEMLVNPYQITMNVDELSTVAKASRRTDIYAFAMLCWQLLSQRRPFAEVQGEVMLCSQVHQDYRPPLNKLPRDTPLEVVNMIRNCWDKDRAKRYTASECCEILSTCYQTLVAASTSNNCHNVSPSNGTSNNSNSSDKSNNGSSNSNAPSRPGSMNLRGGIVNFGGLVVPIPTFDRPKSSARSSLNTLNNSSGGNGMNNSVRGSKVYRSDSMNSDTNDSMQTMTLDYATVRNMMSVHIGRGYNRNSNVSTHSDSASDSDSNSHTGDLASFYSDTDDDDGFHTPAGGGTGANSPTHHHNRRSGTFGAVLGGGVRHYSPDQQQQNQLSQSQQSVDFLEGRDSTMMLNPLTQRPLSGVSQLTRVSGATGSMDSTFSSHSSSGLPSTRSSVSNNSRNSQTSAGVSGSANNSPPHGSVPATSGAAAGAVIRARTNRDDILAVGGTPRTINTTISGMRSSPKALNSSGGGAAAGTTTIIHPATNSILHTSKEHGNNSVGGSASGGLNNSSPSGNSTARSMTSVSVAGATGGAVSGASTARSVINTAPSTARSEESQSNSNQHNAMNSLSRQLSDRLLGLRVSTTGGGDVSSSRSSGTTDTADNLHNSQRHSSQSSNTSSSSSACSSPSKKTMLQKSAEFIMHGLNVSSSLHSSSHQSKQPTEQEQVMLAVLAETEQKQHESERIQHLNQMKQTLTKNDSTALLKHNHNASFRMRKGSEVVLRSGSSSPTRTSGSSSSSVDAVTAALGVDSESTATAISVPKTMSNSSINTTGTTLNTLKTLPSIEESTATGSEQATPRDLPSSPSKPQSRTASPAKSRSPVPVATSSPTKPLNK